MEVMPSVPPKIDQYKPFATLITRESFVCFFRLVSSCSQTASAYHSVKIYGMHQCIWQYFAHHLLAHTYIHTGFFAAFCSIETIQLACTLFQAFSVLSILHDFHQCWARYFRFLSPNPFVVYVTRNRDGLGIFEDSLWAEKITRHRRPMPSGNFTAPFHIHQGIFHTP